MTQHIFSSQLGFDSLIHNIMRRLETLPKRLTLPLGHVTCLSPLRHDSLKLLRQGDVIINCRQRLEPLTKRGLNTDVRPLLPLDQATQLTHPTVQSALRGL